MIFKDSILVEYLYIRPEKQDTVYNIYDQMAEPPGGLQNYYAKLISTLKYPFLKQIAGEEKKIHIRFVVDEYGSLTEFEALTQKITRFETKTIKELSKLPPWKPAKKDGKPVKTRFLLPVIFELK